MNSNKLKELKTRLKLTHQQKNIIIGTLLGDSCLRKSGAEVPLYNLKFEQKIGSRPYIEFLYDIFRDWCGTEPRIRHITGGGAENRESVCFATYGHPSFTFYADVFYRIDSLTNKRRKVVPKLIHRWLNAETVAMWFMDDGSKDRSGYKLNTQGFTLKENERLADALGKAFKFEVNIHADNNKKTGKKGYRLYITANSRDDFTKLVKPFVLPCFYYKLHGVSS